MTTTDTTSDLGERVIGLESAALDRWCRGDPGGFLELIDPAVTYFDPFRPRRIDGEADLRTYYEALRGRIRAESWRMVDPAVRVIGEVAILTFRFESEAGDGAMRWNATEVWHCGPAGPRIVHTQWAFAAE